MKDTHTPTYTGRSTQLVRIKATHDSGQLDTEAVYSNQDGLDGWSWGGHQTLRDVQAGDVLMVETVRFSEIVGAYVDGEQVPDPLSSNGWRFRKSDQELAAAHAARVFALDRRREVQLEANRVEWQAREDALPDWLRERLVAFHQSGGHAFDVDGWGYELMICELAALYDADDDWKAAASALPDGASLSSLPDPAPVMELAHREGTSGNQHGFAMSLVMAHEENPQRTMAGTVSALSPLTGDPDYSAKGGPDVAATMEEHTVAPAVVRVVFQVEGETDLVVEHPLKWDQDMDPDAITDYTRTVLGVLADADLLDQGDH